MIFFFFFFFGYAAIWNSKALHWPHSWEGFLICGNFSSFTTPSPGWVSVPKCFFSLIIFIFMSSFQRNWFTFLGNWGLSPAFRSCFVEVAPYADDFLIYLWKRKWSPHPIPPPPWDCSPSPSNILWSLVFLWCQLKQLLFHFWFYWFGPPFFCLMSLAKCFLILFIFFIEQALKIIDHFCCFFNSLFHLFLFWLLWFIFSY